jgi:hypothetical protein
MADDDQKMTESRQVDTVNVAVVGVGDSSRLTSGAVAETKGLHEPNIVAQVIPPAMALAIRFVKTFLTTLVGLMAAGSSSGLIPAHDFWDLILKCASLSVGAAVADLLKNVVTVFGKLENKYPLIAGNV